MTILNRTILGIKLLLNAPLHTVLRALSQFWPRDPKRWLFGHSGGQFAGNSKYLFLWISIFRPDLKVAWMSRDRRTRQMLRRAGFSVHAFWSPRGIAAALNSRVFIFCHGVTDLNFKLGGGALLVNLWHGIGLKATLLGDKAGQLSRYQKYFRNPLTKAIFLEWLVKPDVLVTTSSFTQSHFAHQLQVSVDKCPPLGYSRLDSSLVPQLSNLSRSLGLDPGHVAGVEDFNEVYLYMPTWRDSGREFLADAIPDPDVLSRALSFRNAVLFIKMHSWTSDTLNLNYPNITYWPEGADVYDYLGQVDCLITDYSSVLYDYLFLRDSGAVIYSFDLEKYTQMDKPLLYDFEENTAGLRVSNFEDLCKAIRTGVAIDLINGRELILEKFWGGSRGSASDRITRYIEASCHGAVPL